MLTTKQAVELVSRAAFRPFDEQDGYAFAGVEDPEAQIAEVDGYVIIADGGEYVFITLDETGSTVPNPTEQRLTIL